jgi:hypothetical protein
VSVKEHKLPAKPRLARGSPSQSSEISVPSPLNPSQTPAVDYLPTHACGLSPA